MELRECFKIGHIMKSHGLKGEVTLSMTQECPDPNELRTVYIHIKGQLVPFFLQRASNKGLKAYVKFDDVDTPEKAASLKGCSVYLSLSERPKAGPLSFYRDEVIGFSVVDKTQGPLGTVKDLLESGTNRHLVVSRNGKEVLIPLNGPFIKKVSRPGKTISVDLPDGLVDI